MGDRTWWFDECPNCGKEKEVYDAPSSIIWSNHCDNCGWDDGLNYYENKDGITVHKLTYSEATKVRKKLYQAPHGIKAPTQPNPKSNTLDE